MTASFEGSITFDGPGGSDTQTAGGGHWDSFLTSYHAFQSNITTVSDSLTGNNVVLTTPSVCANESATISNPTNNTVKDTKYTYPAGLLSFTTNCGTPGYTASITIDFYGLTNTNLVLRKYNPNTQTYVNVPGASVTNTTISGQPVVEATYSITDGGPLDEDSTANGIIVDPVGLAEQTPAAPNTGLTSYLSNPIRTLVIFSLIAGSLYGVSTAIRKQ
jgi:hypothetical protein